jgi:NitT/TauT family transport system substrate-binding protein
VATSSGGMFQHKPRILALALAVTVGLVSFGCSSSASPSTASTSPAAASKNVGTLNVTTSGVSLSFAPFWIAAADGLFAKNGVTVNLINDNAPLVQNALLISGQADLVIASYSSLLSLQTQGQPLVGIFNLANQDWRFATVLSSPSVKSIADLKALGSNCKVAAPAVGTSLYGYMLLFLKAHGLQNCQYVTAPTLPALTAAIASGAADAAFTQEQPALAAVATGVGNIIFDPTTVSPSVGEKILSTPFPTTGVFGLAPNLASKKPAVTAFLRALRQANVVIANETPQDLANLTVKYSQAFGTTPAASLVVGYEIAKPETPSGADAGFISATAWETTLKNVVNSGLNTIKLDDPALAYKKAIDTSYFAAATPPSS